MRLLPLLLLACGAPVQDEPPPGPAPSDTDTDTNTNGPTLTLSELGWSVHPEIGSLVEVHWDQNLEAEVSVEVSFDDGVWEPTPAEVVAAGTHARTVVGIPFATTAQWRVVSEHGSWDGPDLTTAPLPAGLPVPTLELADPTGWDPAQRYLLYSVNESVGGWVHGTFWTAIVDRQGRVVWAHEAPDMHWTLFPQLSVTGTYILWDEGTYQAVFDAGLGAQVHRWYLDGPIESIATPGLRHPFLELPDGTIAWSGITADGEVIYERPPRSTEPTEVYRCTDGCSSNCLYFDPVRNTYLYSFFSHNTLTEIDRAAGTELWWAGLVPGGYAFEPWRSQFYWQHGVSWTADGTLLVSTRDLVDGSPRTFAREYEVDHDARTLTRVWEFDAGVHARTGGHARKLPNGNVLHMTGSAGTIKEVAPSGTVVWHLDYHAERLVGRGELLEDLYALLEPAP